MRDCVMILVCFNRELMVSWMDASDEVQVYRGWFAKLGLHLMKRKGKGRGGIGSLVAWY